MAPVATTPHKSNGHQRYLPKDAPNFPKFDLDNEGSDAEAGALQTVNEPQEPEWEGFEGLDEDKDGKKEDENMDEDEDEDEESDTESVVIELEKKKKEKIILPKDAEEEELERMIFGDSAGFKEGLEAFSLKGTAGAYGDSSDEEQGQDADLDNVADQDLFFFDAGPVAAPAGSVAITKTQDSEDEGDRPAWEDSDDERLVVSLASVPQLRKLRDTAEDDLVNGKEYARRLRKQYERLYPTPDWAMYATGKANKKRRRTINDEEDSGEESASDMDVDEEDLSTQPLARLLKEADILSRNARGPAKRRKLQAGTVDIQRLKDVSKAGPSAITSLSFHPAYPLLLSSGPSSTLHLHHVNPNPPNPNPLLTSLHIKRTPLTTTAFHPSASDSRIFLSARRRYFHVWNIATGSVEKVSRVYGHQHEQRTMEYFSLSPNGKHMALRGSSRKGGGVINILDAKTLQWVTQARIESRGGVADFVWWGDGSGLSIAGKNGEVTEWSVEQGVVGRWNDEGAVGTTVIALGGKSGRESWIGGDRWVAIGSSSGVVNIYDRRAWSENDPTVKNAAVSNNGIPKAPKPLRALQNLTTPISHLAFSPDGQVMAMASRWKNNAMRLVHLPSATVFKNWPTEKTPLGRITSVAWGRPSEEEEREGSLALVAVANETGHIRLWEVRA
ncbi:U3 small nucleolar RNA-associated protein-like protein [Dothidotthia symphoricarpi CBS 119687]|uniref:U3 small nucleolar RNA-associated protein-like protein n=1 Tax=Dothidotthia symphoricarpi CBS 119687 TaxID=1392245 RepID=A0A6A6AU03_9PLEO|nr:U3 small nucleolar RNA-associated protein-like protein [Dothidotthia symphoricarpi CBS 119687]KAF2134668.1 U3 small nucleolar RNA-associated protein-like protein [Dothidotthia symphoricarpi CBS 119687]